MTDRPVWISRPLLNLKDLFHWGVEAGIQKMMPAEHLHATLATVRTPVDWTGLEPMNDEIVVPAGLKTVQIFAYTIKALTFGHPAFRARHEELLRIMPTMDHPILRPHVSLFKGGRMPRLPYEGELVFGPERIVEFDPDNVKGIKHVRVTDLLAAA